MNKKRFAIKFAELKDQTTYNRINRVFDYLVNFDMQEFPEAWFTSTKADLIYNWTLTIFESDLDDESKKQVLKDAVDDLITEDSDKNELKGILDSWETGAWKEIIVEKEVIKYIEKEPDFDVAVLLESYLPITFFDDENDEFKHNILNSFKENKVLWNQQFAYIAYYMLFISYLYKITRELKTIWASDIIQSIDEFVNEKLNNDFNFIFDLSWIKETEFCWKINRFLRCLHNNKVDEIVNFVQKRNHCAHPSWIIQYSESEIDNLILKMNNYTEEIQNKINSQLLDYVKNNLDTISFNSYLTLSENEILFLLSKKDEILNFNSDTDENIKKKCNFLNLIYNNYTENINFEDWKIFNLFLELFSWYDKNIDLYDSLQELYTIIKSFTKEQDNQIIEKIKEFWLDSDDEAECISYIENI